MILLRFKLIELRPRAILWVTQTAASHRPKPTQGNTTMTIAIPSDTTRIFIDRSRFVQAMTTATLQGQAHSTSS